MKLYIDCEWNDYKGDLISMALVSEDGRVFYQALEVQDPSRWVIENVLSVLDIKPVSLSYFQEALETYLQQFDTFTIVADWPEDIAHFCNALITEPGSRLKTASFGTQLLTISSASSKPHNALADALAFRQAAQEIETFQQF